MKDIDKYELFYNDLINFLNKKGVYSIGNFKIEIVNNKNLKVTINNSSVIFTDNFNDLVDLYNKAPIELKEDINLSKFARLTCRKFRKNKFKF